MTYSRTLIQTEFGTSTTANDVEAESANPEIKKLRPDPVAIFSTGLFNRRPAARSGAAERSELALSFIQKRASRIRDVIWTSSALNTDSTVAFLPRNATRSRITLNPAETTPPIFSPFA